MFTTTSGEIYRALLQATHARHVPTTDARMLGAIAVTLVAPDTPDSLILDAIHQAEDIVSEHFLTDAERGRAAARIRAALASGGQDIRRTEAAGIMRKAVLDTNPSARPTIPQITNMMHRAAACAYIAANGNDRITCYIDEITAASGVVNVGSGVFWTVQILSKLQGR